MPRIKGIPPGSTPNSGAAYRPRTVPSSTSNALRSGNVDWHTDCSCSGRVTALRSPGSIVPISARSEESEDGEHGTGPTDSKEGPDGESSRAWRAERGF